MEKVQIIQSSEYVFPYHYLPRIYAETFMQGRMWSFSLSYAIALKLIEEELVKSNPVNHLDIGCGDGALIYYLSKTCNNIKFTGIDYDEHAIKWAGMLNDKKNIFRCIDILSTSLNKKYTSASLIEVIEHIPPDQLIHFIRSVRKTLKKGAQLVITVPHKNKIKYDKHYQHFDFNSLNNILSEYFQVDKILGFERNNKLEYIYKRLTLRENIFIDSKYINKIRLQYQLKNIDEHEKGAGRIFCVCHAI